MEIQPLQRADYKLLLSWFDDEETTRRLSGFYPVREQLKQIEASPYKHVWLARKGGVAVGLVELEIEGEAAYPMILIAPAARRRGYGYELVAGVIPLASALKVKELHAGVAINNTASGKCFKRAGFELRKEVDGYNHFVFSLAGFNQRKKKAKLPTNQ